MGEGWEREGEGWKREGEGWKREGEGWKREGDGWKREGKEQQHCVKKFVKICLGNSIARTSRQKLRP